MVGRRRTFDTTKFRTAIASLAAVFAVAVVPVAAEAAIKAKPTGDPALDDYCQKAARLIDYAVSQSDLANIDGRDEDAAAWDALAAEMIRRSTAAGCTFYAGRVRPNVSSTVPVDGVPTTPELTNTPTRPTVTVRGISPGG